MPVGGATKPLFQLISDDTIGDHRYIRVGPVSPSTLAADIAPRVTGEYLDESASRRRLLDAARDLAVFEGAAFELSAEDLEAALEEEREAILPRSWRGDRPKALDTQRSEFGEIVAAEVLSSVFGSRIPASRIRKKEIPDQATRGADVIALEGTPGPACVLVLGEVKGSGSATSPPGVVADMAKKLKALATDRRALLQELLWLRENSFEEHAEECANACAAFLLRKHKFEVVLAPILVRTAATHKESDQGVFRAAPSGLGGKVRWISIVLEVDDLFELAKEVYEIAGSKVA